MTVIPLTKHLPSEYVKGVDELTCGERRVLNLMLTGMSKREIADYLGTTRDNVSHTATLIFGKLNVSSHIQLLGLCIEGLMPVDYEVVR